MQREKFSSQFADIDPKMYLTDSTNLSNVFFIYPALFSNFLADIFWVKTLNSKLELCAAVNKIITT